MIKKYVKKPISIEACQWNGNNEEELRQFVGSDIYFDTNDRVKREGVKNIYIITLEGQMRGHIGDYIIKGIQGELYPCKPDIFEETYEKVEMEQIM